MEEKTKDANSKTEKRILELNHDEARCFFKLSKSYCSIDLPPYFDFSKLIQNVSDYLSNKNIEGCRKTIKITDDAGKEKDKVVKPENYEDVNYLLFNNKDGQYDWRPLQIINPALYVALVDKITTPENWQLILDRFQHFQENNQVEVMSIPLKSEGDRTDKGETIYQWWRQLEQKSVELALDFDYIMHTDISNCYNSIYTHSISWALHDREVSKAKRKKNQLLGNYIDCSISEMQYGQTNGIPQGSVLMDFIAEMVLGYADKLLTEKINHLSDFKILRYRDDYRILSNNPKTIEEVTKKLSEVLSELGLKLNANKTYISEDVISASVKSDKAYWFSNKRSPRSFQKKLFVLYQFSRKFPNSGTLITELNKFLKILERNEKFKEDIYPNCSILVALIINNPKIFPVGTALLSQLLSKLKSEEARNELLSRIIQKFNKVPNTGLLEIWLQRIILKRTDLALTEPLTHKVNGSEVKIWELDWLNDELKGIIESSDFIDREMYNQLDEVIPSSEVEIFESKDS